MHSKWKRGLALSLSLWAVALMGCAEEREPINRVQSDALAKSFFVGSLTDSTDDPVFYWRNFVVDASSLTQEGRNTIEGWARLMRQNPTLTAAVEGHADERGTREYNLALGERRAVAARTHLVSLGIQPQRVTTVSYGKERPAVVGSNEAAWAQNRRAVLVPAQ